MCTSLFSLVVCIVVQVRKRIKLREDAGRGWEVKNVLCLYKDDTMMRSESIKDLQKIVSEFERACDRMGLKT